MTTATTTVKLCQLRLCLAITLFTNGTEQPENPRVLYLTNATQHYTPCSSSNTNSKRKKKGNEYLTGLLTRTLNEIQKAITSWLGGRAKSMLFASIEPSRKQTKSTPSTTSVLPYSFHYVSFPICLFISKLLYALFQYHLIRTANSFRLYLPLESVHIKCIH